MLNFAILIFFLYLFSSIFCYSLDEYLTHKISLTVAIDGKCIGEIHLGLFGKVAPKTVENFYHICLGDKKLPNGTKMSYDGSPFHRIIPGFVIQGGDITDGNGRGGYSIFGKEFNDEAFVLKHNTTGLLSMANRGKNTNSSQFFITLAKTPWLDGKHVVFGKVLNGTDIIQKIEALGSGTGKVEREVILTKCTVLQS